MPRSDFDYPLTLAGSHGRIAAYRAALREAEAALATATPYVNRIATDRSLDLWRQETAAQSLETIRSARALIAAELAVTTGDAA